MRMVTFPFAGSTSFMLAGKVSCLSLLAALGACSNFASLRSPVFTGSTNQEEIINTPMATAYQAPLGGNYVGTSTASTQGADLPPPSGTSPPPAYAAAPQPYQAPQAYALAEPSAAQPKYMQAGTSAQRGAPPTTLNAEANQLRVPPRAVTPSSGTHLVQSGDTAWNIAHRYGLSVERTAANGGSTNVKLGQRLVIPGGAGAAPQSGVQLASPARAGHGSAALPPDASSTAAAAAEPPSSRNSQHQDLQFRRPAGQQLALARKPAARALAAAQPSVTDDNASGFRWPVRGRIISGFGKKANGERNDGINLAVPEGTQVKAAEDGIVIYAGNELKSYGNLVLIRHNTGWVSAYAHNSKLQVKRGEAVKRGQVIALSGMSGGVTTPQVHFELRKDATPVDPLQHLTES
jgi:murein DD-endopeptidase MepM/ murein hydrolase activator NlpD